MWKREHCEPAARETSADNAPAAHETEALVGALERKKDLVLSAPPRVDDGEVAYTPVDAACGSNPSRGWAETRPPLDVTAGSPGAALLWPRHSIETSCARRRTTPYEKDILKRATSWREDDEQCTYASVP